MTAQKTPLYQCHVHRGCLLVEFANTMLPVRFDSEKEEHMAVRNHVGIFDISHMGEFMIEGSGAHDFLQHVLSNNVDKLSDFKAQYTLMLQEDGGIIDDLIVYRLSHTKYLLIVNAANKQKDFAHLLRHQKEFSAVEIRDESDKFGLIAVQGPKALPLIASISNEELPPRFAVAHVVLAGVKVLLARTGYTGEDGFEIVVNKEDAAKLWQSLLECGAPYNVKPCGLAARDSLRLEAGLLLHGQDMDETTSPLEARLMFAVDLKKSAFVGKDALMKAKLHGVAKKLMPFVLSDAGIARHGFRVVDAEHQEIGVVTSGTLLPHAKNSIGLAYLKTPYAHEGQEIFVDIRGRLARARVYSSCKKHA